MNWKTHAPTDWKIGTLKTLIKLAKTICSNENLLKTEINHLTLKKAGGRGGRGEGGFNLTPPPPPPGF